MKRNPRMRTLRIVRLVDDDLWQSLRASLVGKWQTRPAECVEALRAYLEQNTTERAEQRVMNLLTGTAFRCGTVVHQCINEFRLDVAGRLRARGAESAQLRPTHFCPTCAGRGWDAFGLCPNCRGTGIKWGAEKEER